jgi:exodeoxyribonuclease-3
MKIATWNVNSIRARLAHVTDWLATAQPDVLLLQELKCTNEDFPRVEIEATGYHAEVLGQKAYNGVAILARDKIEGVLRGLPGHREEEARYIEGTVKGTRVASIYLPNGNPIGTDKFKNKLHYFDCLYEHARALLKKDMPIVLGGDLNCCPTDEDVWDMKAMAKDALVQPETRAAWRKIIYQGWTDALRAIHPHGRHYTYWDYFQNRFERDHGLRIDFLLLSAQATDRLDKAEVDRTPRAKEKASDHTPVWCTLN